jgi:hypothetical protein
MHYLSSQDEVYNNNNNNIYLLQMGCHPVAVITLHVFPNTANKFTYGGLHEKHVVSTGKHGNHLSICFKTRGRKPRRKTCAEMAGRRTFRVLTASQPPGK